MTQHRDQNPAATVTIDAPETAPDRPKLEISATTITTGVVASSASAMLGSTLGVAGTLVGAALGAAAYSVAAALYTHSVATAKYRVHELRARAERGAPTDRARSSAGGAAADTVEEVVTPPTSAAVGPTSPQSQRPVGARTRVAARTGGNGRAVLAGALGAAFAFALALLLVTGIESFKGAPLSGGTAGGLTVLGGSSQGDPAAARPAGVGAARSSTDASAVSSSTTVTHTSTATETAIATQTSTQTATATATETSTATETTVVTAPATTLGTPPATAPAPSPGPPSASDATPAAPTTEPTATGPVHEESAGSSPAE